MDSLLILIPVALLFVAIAIKAFFWAVDNSQYDDLDAAGQSILFEEDFSKSAGTTLAGTTSAVTSEQQSATGVRKPGADKSEELLSSINEMTTAKDDNA